MDNDTNAGTAVASTGLLADLSAAQTFIADMAEQIIDPLVVRVRFLRHANAVEAAGREITRLRGELEMAATNLPPDSPAYKRAVDALHNTANTNMTGGDAAGRETK